MSRSKSLPSESFEVNGVNYETTAHAPTRSLKLATEIYATLSGPAVDILKSFMSAEDELGDESVREALAEIDSDKLGNQLQKSLRDLDQKYIRELFSKTRREFDDGTTKELSEDLAFNQAYAGNWSEMLRALVEIVKVNGFVDFLSTTIDENEPTGGSSEN